VVSRATSWEKCLLEPFCEQSKFRWGIHHSEEALHCTCFEWSDLIIALIDTLFVSESVLTSNQFGSITFSPARVFCFPYKVFVLIHNHQ
jgi:hypothetical protein